MCAVNQLADCRGDWTFSCTSKSLLSPSAMLSHVQISSPTMDLTPSACAEPDKSTSQQSVYTFSNSIEGQSACIIQRQGNLWYLPVQASFWARWETVFELVKFWWFFSWSSCSYFVQVVGWKCSYFPQKIQTGSSAYDFSVTVQHVLLTIAALVAEPQCEQTAKARNRLKLATYFSFCLCRCSTHWLVTVVKPQAQNRTSQLPVCSDPGRKLTGLRMDMSMYMCVAQCIHVFFLLYFYKFSVR